MKYEKYDKAARSLQSPIPFWFLNGHLDRWHIQDELDKMKAIGVTTVIPHPRAGLAPEYLSEEFFDLMGIIIEECKKRDITIWAYDEYDWPSGTAHHQVMKTHPEFRGKYLETTVLNPDEAFDGDLGDYAVAAFAESDDYISDTKVIKSKDDLLNLTEDHKVYVFKMKYDDCYVDTLSKEAVDCFKEMTYEKYYEHFAEDFGKTIVAFFTDEPSVYWVSVGYDDMNLPYTTDFFETFRERYGYDPVERLPYLFARGVYGSSFRADFNEHAGNLFNERYHGNLAAWCRDHGVIYTGHNNCEEPLKNQIRFEEDMQGTMRTMDIPGVDHLLKDTLGNYFISIIGHKLCTSQAHVEGKSRCMSESFGVSDWDVTFTVLKRIVSWQYALGINLLISHALYHTVGGKSKRESPPSLFHQSPLWKDFDYFADYVRNMESMLTGGRHDCRVAVVYPLSGLHAAYRTDKKTDDFARTENFLNQLCLEFVKKQIDFDLIDISTLDECEVKEGKLCVADEVYSDLVVPYSIYMRLEEAKKLAELKDAGVHVAVFYREENDINVSNSAYHALKGIEYVKTNQAENYAEIMRKSAEDLFLSGSGAEDIMVYRRIKNGKKIIFMLNRNAKHHTITALLEGLTDPAIYNPETGEYRALDFKKVGKKIQAKLKFNPNDAFFIVDDMPKAKRVEEPVLSEKIAVSDLKASIPYNVCRVFNFSFTDAETGETRDFDVRTDPRNFFPPWVPPMNEAVDVGTYTAKINVTCKPLGTMLVCDKDFGEYEVKLNGTKLDFFTAVTEDRKGFYLTDYSDVCCNISSLLIPGENVFEIKTHNRLSEPLSIVGGFNASADGKSLTPPTEVDPFKALNTHPFYSGTVSYSCKFNLDRMPKKVVLDLGPVADAAAVSVNGKKAGKRLWEPYKLDITEFAETGGNLVEIETRNTPINLLSGKASPFGLKSTPLVEIYR